MRGLQDENGVKIIRLCRTLNFRLDEKKDEISLEELIEQRRAELGARTDLTPVNIESFVKWKKRKLAEKVQYFPTTLHFVNFVIHLSVLA